VRYDGAVKTAPVVNVTQGTIIGRNIGRADNLWTRFRGLMLRAGLAEDEGLFIVPCSSIHMFLMRFALDVVYLDKELKVVKTVPNLKPWRISFGGQGKSMLELPVGAIARSRTRTVDRIAVGEVPSAD
jgi:uncharacterized membrane protein (UPF0127 family)